MVSLSDIPVVGKAVDMISEAMVNAVYRGLRYMFCYKNLVNNFNSELEKFNIEERRVSRKVVQERDNGKIIEDHVSKWQKEVEGIQQDSEEFMERYKSRASWRCIQCVPNIPNPFNRFRIGRDAVKKADKLAGLTQKGKDLLTTEIARLPDPGENLQKTDGEFQNFPSRNDAYKKIWNSLVSEDGPQILGIYGMPGVGKTRIAEQISEDAKKKGVFKKVTKAVVSAKDLDVKRLQNELAGDLNCDLESQDGIKRRASQLKQIILNGGKVLIILDDVWREISLHDIGIPIGHDDTTSSKGTCKILLTSRKKNVLRGNKCTDPVEITALKDDEAWDMFKESVGTGDIPDESLARKVCEKCAGLPLVIHAVGKALQFESCDVWNEALVKLVSCDIEGVPEIDQQVYTCLKLSFDMLEPVAKLCLLLCSLYPEDAEISIDMLIELATGSQLVQGGRDGRISVRAKVAILKSSSLVLESENGGDCFKLHDIIRDVARSIAVRDYAFSFARCDSRLPANHGSAQVLCLEVKESDDMMNQDIHLIKNDILHTLWIGSAAASIYYHLPEIQVPEVASMFVNLRCLILRNMRWEPVQQLGELRTLVLERCDIRKTNFSFISEKLETLCIWRCHLPEEPLNIINLKHLRKLEILKNWIPKPLVLVVNTISSLSSCLEELYIPYGYSYHKEEEHNDDEVNYNNSISQQLAEFTNFRRLKSLNMSFSEVSHDDISVQAPKVISNLSEFHISVGGDPVRLLRISASYPSLTRKAIHLRGKRFEASTFQSLIERAQVVILTSTNVDVSSAFNTNNTQGAAAAAYADLKHLEICGSDTMEHLAKISHHHHLYQIQPARTSFFKLTTLEIAFCSAMKYLFCNSVAKCLVQLEELRVNDCPVMEAIVMNEGSSNSDGEEEEEEDINIINFPKLKSLELSYMPKLKSFSIEKKKKKKKDIMQHTASTISLSDNSVIIPAFTLFPKQIAFTALEKLRLNNMEIISDIWGKHYFNDNASSFSKLKSLEVSSCTKMETVIPLAMLHKLQNLEELIVDNCEMMTEIIGAAAGEHKISTGGIIFPKLRTLVYLN